MSAPALDVEAYARAFAARAQRARERVDMRAAELRHRAAQAAHELARVHGATRVWHFGSLAWGTPHEASDVDLLLEGVPERDWLAVIATAERVVNVPVDVVRVEDAAPGLSERVMREGVLLHGA